MEGHFTSGVPCGPGCVLYLLPLLPAQAAQKDAASIPNALYKTTGNKKGGQATLYKFDKQVINVSQSLSQCLPAVHVRFV